MAISSGVRAAAQTIEKTPTPRKKTAPPATKATVTASGSKPPTSHWSENRSSRLRTSWNNVSDESFGGSIGAVAVSEWDPNVIYVGGGEKTVRGNVSHGDGVWRSDDAGKTWTLTHDEPIRQMVFTYGYYFGEIRVSPNDENRIYITGLSMGGGGTWNLLNRNPDRFAAAVPIAGVSPAGRASVLSSRWRSRRCRQCEYLLNRLLQTSVVCPPAEIPSSDHGVPRAET